MTLSMYICSAFAQHLLSICLGFVVVTEAEVEAEAEAEAEGWSQKQKQKQKHQQKHQQQRKVDSSQNERTSQNLPHA